VNRGDYPDDRRRERASLAARRRQNYGCFGVIRRLSALAHFPSRIDAFGALLSAPRPVTLF